MKPLAIACAIAAASLIGNAWQWRNSGVTEAKVESQLDKAIDANAGQHDALAQCQARMWEAVGEGTKDKLALERSTLLHTQLNNEAAAAAAKRDQEVQRAYRNPDAAKWGALPVPPSISRLYTQGSNQAGGDGNPRPGAEAVPGSRPPR